MADVSAGQPTKASSTITLSLSTKRLSIGQAVTATVTVTGSAGTPTGRVKITGGFNSMDAMEAGPGKWQVEMRAEKATPRIYTVYAKYSGDDVYYPNQSGGVDVVLTLAATETTLTITPQVVTRATSSITFTANVRRSAEGSEGAPGGNVFFQDQTGMAFGSGRLNYAGTATFAAAAYSFHATATVTANYVGGYYDKESTSAPVVMTVE